MPKNEDGEFELVLGNKQLLSMFFVVVILLGVFFVMGYIVGRNSAPMTAVEPAHKPEGKPMVVESPAPKASETPAASAPATAPGKPVETPAAAATPATLPPAAAETAKPEPAAKAKSEKTEAKTEAKADAKVDTSKAAKGKQSNTPAAGATYLQLSATSKHDADAMVDELRKNSFLALDVEVPEKPGTFRVLVGPIPTGELNKTKTELQNKSFPGNAAIKKTF